MRNFLEVTKTTAGTVKPNGNIIFNQASPFSEGITYDPVKGTVTLPKPGVYSVNWWIATQTTLTGSIQFAIKTSQGDIIPGVSPVKTGQVTGFGEIRTQSAGVTLSLVCMCPKEVILPSNCPVVASLVVIKVAEDGVSPGPAAIVPFSIGKHGTSFSCNANGTPIMAAYSGFASASSDITSYLKEEEWNTGRISIDASMNLGSPFIMPHNAKLKKIHVAFIPSSQFPAEASDIRPFVCLCLATGPDLGYTILKNTLTYTAPFPANQDFTPQDFKKGSKDFDIDIPEGSMIAILTGITSDEPGKEIYISCAVSGGLYFE